MESAAPSVIADEMEADVTSFTDADAAIEVADPPLGVSFQMIVLVPPEEFTYLKMQIAAGTSPEPRTIVVVDAGTV